MSLKDLAPLINTRGDGTPYLTPYAWPGGYPIVYVDERGKLLCPECATHELWAEDERDKIGRAHV